MAGDDHRDCWKQPLPGHDHGRPGTRATGFKCRRAQRPMRQGPFRVAARRAPASTSRLASRSSSEPTTGLSRVMLGAGAAQQALHASTSTRKSGESLTPVMRQEVTMRHTVGCQFAILAGVDSAHDCGPDLRPLPHSIPARHTRCDHACPDVVTPVGNGVQWVLSYPLLAFEGLDDDPLGSGPFLDARAGAFLESARAHVRWVVRRCRACHRRLLVGVSMK